VEDFFDVGSKEVSQLDADAMRVHYEQQMRHGAMHSAIPQGLGIAASQSVDTSAQKRSEARAEYMRRLMYDVPEVRGLDYFDVQINPTNEMVVVFMIVRGEVMHFAEDQHGFPSREFIAKMGLLF
jgi:hypothetical protein